MTALDSRPARGYVCLVPVVEASYIDQRGRLLDQHGRPLTRAVVTADAGAPGTVIFGGFIQASSVDYASAWVPPTRWTTVDKMVSDETIDGLFSMLVQAGQSATWSVEPASDDPRDVEVADFVRAETIDRTDGWTWNRFLELALHYWTQGCQFLVPRWEARARRDRGIISSTARYS